MKGSLFRRRSGISFYGLFYRLFIFFCYFPFLYIIDIPTDSQPYALLFGGCIVLYGLKYKLRWEFKVLIVVCIFSLIGLFFDASFNSIRSVLNYVSILFIPLATYRVLRTHRLSYNFFKLAIIIWGIVGVIQLLYSPTFGSFLKFRSQGETLLESGRGCTSLAPEPTFYGTIILLFMIVGWLNFRYKKSFKIWMLVLVFQLLIMSRSSMCIVFVGMSIIIYSIVMGIMRKPKLLIICVLFFVGLLVGINQFQDFLVNYRAGRLIVVLLNNPSGFVVSDASVNERFIHAFFSIYGFFENFGIPHFYGEFNDYMKHIVASRDFHDLLFYYRTNYTRILSSVGCALFELGYVGLLIFFVLFKDIARCAKRNIVFWFIGLLFFCILLNAMPLTNGLVGFVFGNIIYRKYYPLMKEADR